MDKLLHKIKLAKIFGIILPFMLFFGILMIVLGAVNQLWVVMAFGIAFVLCGFYGTPLVWVGYSSKVIKLRTVRCIEENKPTDIVQASNFLGISLQETSRRLRACLQSGLICGCRLTDDGKILYGKQQPPLESKQGKVFVKKCDGCGARVSIKEFEQQVLCPYCGNPISKN